MAPIQPKSLWFFVAAIVITIVALFIFLRTPGQNSGPERKGSVKSVPVEVAEIRQGPLSLMRTFSGTIEPLAQFTVAPKISGRLQRLHVGVSDQVNRGQLVVEMEDGEYRQEVIEAEAQFAVAEANHVEAASRLKIAQRELDRAKTLYNRGVAAESDFDTARASFLTSQATLKVAEAHLKRDEALLMAARIRLDYTQVKAEWEKGDDQRTVAERFINEGATVAANTPILSIVELDPVIVVFQVTEKDYPLIRLDQQAQVTTDSFPNRVFSGKVTRIAPIFRETSRQARIELRVDNPDHQLKPGMFSRCTLELKKEENSISVPLTAITERNGKNGLFKVNDEESTVEWVPVTLGFTDGTMIQLISPEISGKVVTIGQQFIKDGSPIRIVTENTPAAGGSEAQ